MADRIPPISKSSDLVVSAELPCRRCRYPLRGLAVETRCPECGLPVDETLRSSIDLATLELGSSDGEPGAHRLTAVLLHAAATALATIAGLAIPIGVISASTTFDPGGGGPTAAAAANALAPWLRVLAVGCLVTSAVALLSTPPSPRSGDGGTATGGRFGPGRRAGAVATALLIVAGVLTGVPGFFLPPDQARDAGTWATIAVAGNALRGGATMLLLLGLTRRLEPIGRRSEAYATAGQGLQGPRTAATTTVVALIASVAWLWTFLASSGSRLADLLAMVPWSLLWAASAGLAALGGTYLAANALWATAPWRRRHRRLGQLVGPAPGVTTGTSGPSSSAASMADEEDPKPSG